MLTVAVSPAAPASSQFIRPSDPPASAGIAFAGAFTGSPGPRPDASHRSFRPGASARQPDFPPLAFAPATSSWQRFLGMNPLPHMCQQDGLARVIAELEHDLPPTTLGQLQDFIRPLLRPLKQYLHGARGPAGREARLATGLQRAWDKGFPALPPALLARLHLAYDRTARRCRVQLLQNPPGHIGRALITVLAERIAGELCLLLVNTTPACIAGLPRLRLYLRGQPEPLEDVPARAIAILMHELARMAQTTAGVAADFRNLLLRQVGMALHEGTYHLRQLCAAPLAVPRPETWRDWALLLLHASRGSGQHDVRARPGAIPAPEDRQATPATGQDARALSTCAITPPPFCLPGAHAAATGEAAALSPWLRQLIHGDWLAGPLGPGLQASWNMTGAPTARGRRSIADLFHFLSGEHSQEPGMDAITRVHDSLPARIDYSFTPLEPPSFARNAVFESFWTQSRSPVEKARTYQFMRDWHRGTSLKNKVETIFDVPRLRNVDSLETAWYDNIPAIPPLADLMARIWRDGLDVDILSEMITLARFGADLMELDSDGAKTLFYSAFHAYQTFRTQYQSTLHGWHLDMIAAHARFFARQPFGYDRFIPFHQYHFSHAGLSRSDCGPTALLYVAAGGDPASLMNARDNLQKAATFAAPARAFRKGEANAGHGPFAAAPADATSLAKALFIAAGMHQLRPGVVFPDDSQFSSSNFVQVSTLERVVQMLRDLPPGMHLVFQKHAPDGGPPMGHTTVLLIEEHHDAPASWRVFDPNFGEFRFPTRQRFLEFVRFAAAQGIVPSLFHFPDHQLHALSIVRHADRRLAQTLSQRADPFQRMLPQLWRPFADIEVIEGYEAALPRYAGLMTLPQRLLLRVTDLPAEARAALPAADAAQPAHAPSVELETQPCPRSPGPACASEALLFRDGQGRIFYRSSAPDLLARYIAHRTGWTRSHQLQLLMEHDQSSNGLTATRFASAVSLQQPGMLAQREAVLTASIRQRIQVNQLAHSLPRLPSYGASANLRPLPALTAAGLSGGLVPAGLQPSSSIFSRQFSAAMARISIAVGTINSAREIAFLSQPGIPRDHPEYARYQVAMARATADLSAQSAYLTGWGAARIANLSPAQQSMLAQALGEFVADSGNLVARLPVPAALKATLARNLAAASEQVPGLIRFMRAGAAAGSQLAHKAGAAGTVVSALFSAVDSGLLLGELHHITDPDRYQAAEGTAAFSCIETGLESGVVIALGTGNMMVAGVLQILDLMVMAAHEVFMAVRGAPLESRAGLRAVDTTLRRMASDYRNPVTLRTDTGALVLDFTSVDEGATGTRSRMNAVAGLDLSFLMDGKIRVHAGAATIATPLTRRMQMPAGDRRGMPFWQTFTNPSHSERKRLSTLSNAPDWTEVAVPDRRPEVTLLLPGRGNDAHMHWRAVNLHDLSDEGLNGPFADFPLKLDNGDHIGQLIPQPFASPAMSITVPAGISLSCLAPAGKHLSFALAGTVLKLYSQADASITLSGKLLPGSMLVFDSDGAATIDPLKSDALVWEGNVLRVASTRIDLESVRVDGPIPVVVGGAQFALHPRRGSAAPGVDGFALAGASIRLSHVDTSKIRNPDTVYGPSPSSADRQRPRGIALGGLMIIFNTLRMDAPEWLSLPVHVLDRNNTVVFVDVVNFDMFSPQAAGWGEGNYTLLAVKKVYGGTLWLIMDDTGTVHSMVRKINPRPHGPTRMQQVYALPPGAIRNDDGGITLNERPDHHRLPFGVLKVWQSGDIVKLLSERYLIYSISFNGTPLLRGAHKTWWSTHFANFDGLGMAVLHQAFPSQSGWLRLSLPNNDVLHFNPAERVAMLTAAGDEVFPVRYIAGNAQRGSAMHLQRPNPNGGVDVATVTLGQTAHRMEDFLLGPAGARAVAGKSPYVPHLTADWEAGPPPDNQVIIIPGPDHNGMLAAVQPGFIARLTPDLARPVGDWLLDSFRKAAADNRVDLGPAIVINCGSANPGNVDHTAITQLVFNTRVPGMTVCPYRTYFVSNDDHHAYFYGIEDNTLYSKPFQSIANYTVADFSRLAHMVDVPGASVALAGYKAHMQEIGIAPHSLWLYTLDGRVLEFPPGLAGTHRREFRPPLVRISEHWFDEQKMAPDDVAAIEERLNDLFDQDEAYSASAVTRPDIISVSRPHDHGLEQDGYYFPQKKQYLAPPAVLLHMTSPADASTRLQPVDIGIPVPGGLWKGAHPTEEGANWYYLVQGGQRCMIGKLRAIESFGVAGNRTLLVTPDDGAREITLPLFDQAIQHYVIQRNPAASAPCTFYMNYHELPLDEIDIWIKGNGARGLAQQYALVVSSRLTLVPGSLQKAVDAEGNTVSGADLRSAGHRTLQLRFTDIGPQDQITVASGMNSHDRQHLILARGDDEQDTLLL